MVKRIISANDIIEDIRSGMGHVPIMEKYQISPTEFMEILTRLEGIEPTESEEVEGRLKDLQEDSCPVEMRSIPRNYMAFRATVQDANDPSVSGLVNDITENGFQVEGIRAHVGETRSFAIRSEVLAADTEIVFDASCRWTKPGVVRDHDIAGFEITSISESSLEELRKLIRHLSLGEQA